MIGAIADEIRGARARLSRAWGPALKYAILRHFKTLMSLYPPYLGAGIRVEEASADLRRVVVSMPLRFYNRNFVGTHFGGSLFAMTDPFYMLMLIQNLGDDYIVWDKATTIRFRRPGRTKVRAEFLLTQDKLNELRHLADTQPTVEPTFTINILDETDQIVAQVEKLLYIRKK